MILDVIALQEAYGEGHGTSGNGDDRIVPGGNGGVISYRTYFDKGGNDTIDLMHYVEGCYLMMGETIAGASHLVGVSMGIADANRMRHLKSDPYSLRWYYGEFESASGSIAGDFLGGNEFANTLLGLDGDDTLSGQLGNDILDGGNGTDSAVFSGNLRDYVITSTTEGYLVSSSIDGLDSLKDIELLQFADQTIVISATDIALPSLSSLSPAQASKQANPSANITLVFSEPVVLSASGSITLKSSDGMVQSFTASSPQISLSGNTLSINPAHDLNIYTTYTIDIAPDAIQDLAGNRFAGLSDYHFRTQTLDGLYHFFVIAFGAAPGTVYMGQLAEAYNFGLGLQQIVEIFTTKPQFTDTYPTSLSNRDLAVALVGNVVKNSAPETTRLEAINDITAALDFGWSRGRMIYQVFGNLANKPLEDAIWGTTAKQFQNALAVARYYTETLEQNSTNMATLRSVIGSVDHNSDVSTPQKIAELIGLAVDFS